MNPLRLLSLSLLALPVGCDTERLAEAAASKPAHAVADIRLAPQTKRKNNDCWWVKTGDHSFVAVWLSPRLAGEEPGGFRFVNLMFHDSKCPRPIALSAGIGKLDRADPVSLRNRNVSFRAVPKKGKTWSDVDHATDLDVQIKRRS